MTTNAQLHKQEYFSGGEEDPLVRESGRVRSHITTSMNHVTHVIWFCHELAIWLRTWQLSLTRGASVISQVRWIRSRMSYDAATNLRYHYEHGTCPLQGEPPSYQKFVAEFDESGHACHMTLPRTCDMTAMFVVMAALPDKGGLSHITSSLQSHELAIWLRTWQLYEHGSRTRQLSRTRRAPVISQVRGRVIWHAWHNSCDTPRKGELPTTQARCILEYSCLCSRGLVVMKKEECCYSPRQWRAAMFVACCRFMLQSHVAESWCKIILQSHIAELYCLLWGGYGQ